MIRGSRAAVVNCLNFVQEVRHKLARMVASTTPNLNSSHNHQNFLTYNTSSNPSRPQWQTKNQIPPLSLAGRQNASNSLRDGKRNNRNNPIISQQHHVSVARETDDCQHPLIVCHRQSHLFRHLDRCPASTRFPRSIHPCSIHPCSTHPRSTHPRSMFFRPHHRMSPVRMR